MAITVDNLADAPKWGETVPDGQYLALVTEAEQTVSSNNNDMIKLSLNIVTGEHAGRNLPFDYLVFSAGALPRVKYVLEALNVPIPRGSFSLDADNLRGKKALVTVKTVHEAAKNGYDARDVLKIIAYDAAPGSAQDTAVEAALGVTPAAATLGNDDDIPF